MSTMLSIKDVCERYQLTEVYVRRMILQGKIPTEKVEIAKNTFKHMMREEDVLDWRSRSKHNRRTDGRGRYLLYANPEEIQRLQVIMENEPGIEGVEVLRQNKVKQLG